MINHNKPGKKPNVFGLSDDDALIHAQKVEAHILENQRMMKELQKKKEDDRKTLVK